MNAPVTWVTGAHGFIGRHVAKYSAAEGHVVHGIGHGPWPASEAREWGISRWLNADVTAGNLSVLADGGIRPDVLVHLAGGSSVGSAIANPREDFSRTVGSTIEILEWVRRESPQTRLVVVSSAAVYGAGHEGLIDENALARPYSPYGYHKYCMEMLCRSYGATYGVKAVVARLFSVYGRGLKKQLLWDICGKLAAGQGIVMLGGTGRELRDWVEVRDVVRILGMLAGEATSDVPTVNVGSGVAVSVLDIARLVADLWHKAIAGQREISFSGVARPGDPFSLIARCDLLARLGGIPEISLQRGVSDYVSWFIDSVVTTGVKSS